VVLITSNSDYCGLGYLDIGTSSSLAFSLISVFCPQSLVHEVGHNIGSNHDREAANNYDYDKYNFGYCWDTSSSTCSRSVMAYSSCDTTNGRTGCPRAFFFSSPDIRDGSLGRTTGIGTSDNVRTHNEHVSACTNWRESSSSSGMLFSVSPNAATSLARGSMKNAANCASECELQDI
jgi:hypothetical protein